MNTVQPEFLGRLGNNMFQIAAAIGYAHKYGTGWSAPAGYHHREIYRFFKPNTCRIHPKKMKLYDVATDEGWGYAPIPFHEGSLRIRGFFQSYKYFEGYEEEVRNAFKLNIQPTGYVSVHIRLGDYLEHKNDFPPINNDYLQAAFKKFPLGQKFLVFSDDLKWCRENMTGFQFEFSPGYNEFHDLSLMASCEHHIIANSTFSWWGAYLGHNPDKIVVSPSHLPGNWFGHNRVDTRDLLPPEWHQIKFR